MVSLRHWLESKHSRNTTHAILQCLKQVYQHAVHKKYLTQNPCRVLTKLTRLPNKKSERYISLQDMEKLLSVLPPEMQALVALTRFCGLRLHEACNLRWELVNWNEGILTVESTKTKRHGTGVRSLPLFADARRFLEHWFSVAEPSTYVFPRYATASHKHQLARNDLAKYCKRVGLNIPRFFQNARRSAATDMAELFPSHAVLSWCGHTAPIAEAHYWRVSQSLIARAVTECRLSENVLPYSEKNERKNSGTESGTDSVCQQRSECDIPKN